MAAPLMLFGYDGIHLANCPSDGAVLYYYVDGIYANHADAVRYANGRVLIGISAVGRELAPVVDCEPNCVWPPANAVAWVRRARAAGIDPVVYVGRANWQAAIDAFAAAGEAEPHWWVAHYTNAQHLCATWCGAGYSWGNVGDREAIATQYGGDQYPGFDRNYISPQMVALVDPTRASDFGYTPIPQEEDEMTPEEHDAVMAAAANGYPFKMFRNVEYPGDPLYTVLVAPGMPQPWHVPSLDYINLIEALGLAKGVKELPDDQFGFVMQTYQLIPSSSAPDFGPLIAKLDAVAAKLDSAASAPAAPGAPVDLSSLEAAVAAVPGQVVDGVRGMTFGAR